MDRPVTGFNCCGLRSNNSWRFRDNFSRAKVISTILADWLNLWDVMAKNRIC